MDPIPSYFSSLDEIFFLISIKHKIFPLVSIPAWCDNTHLKKDSKHCKMHLQPFNFKAVMNLCIKTLKLI